MFDLKWHILQQLQWNLEYPNLNWKKFLGHKKLQSKLIIWSILGSLKIIQIILIVLPINSLKN